MRDGERDYRKRGRSPSPDDFGRDRDRDRGYGGDRDRDRRRRSRSRSPDHGRRERGPPSGSSSSGENTPREARTLKVTQLTAKVTEADLRAYFGDAAPGGVSYVDMPRDNRTGRHRGHAMVELEALADVAVCALLSGAVPSFQKFPIIVAVSAQAAAAAAAAPVTAPIAAAAPASAAQPQPQAPTRLFLGRIPVSVGDAELLPVLAFYGALTSLRLAEVGGHRHAFASYQYEASAAAAAAALQGYRLAGPALPPLQAEVLPALHPPSLCAQRDAALAAKGAVALAAPMEGSTSLFLELAGLAPSPASGAKEYEAGLQAMLEGECLGAQPAVEPVYYKLEPPVEGSSHACVLWEFGSEAAALQAAGLLHGRWLGGVRLRCAFLSELTFHKRISGI